VLSIQPSRFDWFFKYKLYHLPFWFAYHSIWWILRIGSVSEVVNNIFFSPYSIKFAFYVIFQAIGVYFNLYFLMPRFLEKGRYVSYVSLLVFTIICCASFITTGYYVGAWWSGIPFQELYGVRPEQYFTFFTNNCLPSTVASMTLAMSFKLTKNGIEAKRRQQLLEKEKLETELKFLKSQFNPHFLFNTINSIFVLIHKNPDMASESLAKFSDLLRYQLYECNEQQIPLEQELTYLENFIELEKLRQDAAHFELTVHMEPPHSRNLTIAPFILMPFVENAFKHVSQRKDRTNWIRLQIRFEGLRLYFDLSNSKSNVHSSVAFGQHRGIGLKNVQRRLDLIYPGKHHLTIHQDEDQFGVSLQFNLQERRVAEMMPIQLEKDPV
jgi:two-component system, LytTR family, sensor kinase